MKKNKSGILAFIWLMIGFLYAPVFLVFYVLSLVAKVLLALAYVGCLRFDLAKGVIKRAHYID
jgi:hypothetical protein